MERAELKIYRQALERRAAQLGMMVRNRDNIAVEHPAEEFERMVLAGERDLAIQRLDRDSQMLRLIEAAVRRIDEGTYGICEGCEGPVQPKRLAALPWARFCLCCQQRQDAIQLPRPGGRADFAESLAA